MYIFFKYFIVQFTRTFTIIYYFKDNYDHLKASHRDVTIVRIVAITVISVTTTTSSLNYKIVYFIVYKNVVVAAFVFHVLDMIAFFFPPFRR